MANSAMRLADDPELTMTACLNTEIPGKLPLEGPNLRTHGERVGTITALAAFLPPRR